MLRQILAIVLALPIGTAQAAPLDAAAAAGAGMPRVTPAAAPAASSPAPTTASAPALTPAKPVIKKPAPVAAKPAEPKPGLIRPRSSPFDPKLIVFPYTPDYIYPIKTKRGEFTHIELAEGEQFVDLGLPDKVLWDVQVSKATMRDVYVKPMIPNNSAGAALVTTLRRYELSFSVGEDDDGGIWYQRVSWENGDRFTPNSGGRTFTWRGASGDVTSEPLARAMPSTSTSTSGSLAGGNTVGGGRGMGFDAPAAIQRERESAPACAQTPVQVDRLNFNYEVEGDAPFKPSMVFDDGRFTYFKFPRVQDMPILFALNPTTGDAEIEGIVPCKNHYLVQALMPGGALLKLGKAEVKIINKDAQGCGFFRSLFGGCKPVGNILEP